MKMNGSEQNGVNLVLLLRYLFFIMSLIDLQVMASKTNKNSDMNIKSGQYTPPPLYDDYYSYDSGPDFSPSSSYCREKSTCDVNNALSFSDKNCYCDEVCETLNDCCVGNDRVISIKQTKSQFSCVKRPEIVKTPGYGIYLVNKCSPSWNNIKIRNTCEKEANASDLLLNLPVSETGTGTMFRNVFCAHCNHVYDYSFWNAEIKYNSTDTEHIDLSKSNIDFTKPNPTFKNERKCFIDITDSCPSGASDVQLNNNCSNGQFSIVFVDKTIFRNKYCALCNGASSDSIVCYPKDELHRSPDPDKRVYSFRLLVDFNTQDIDIQCNDNEMYDPITKTCREILCFPPRVAKLGKCILGNGSNSVWKNESAIDGNSSNCTIAKFTLGEYNMVNETAVFILSLNRVYTIENVNRSGSDVFICLERNQLCLNDCGSTAGMFQFSEIESYMSLIGLVISIVALAVTFAVYVYFKQLLNTPGKILLCLVVALFLAQLLFLISSEVQGIHQLCQAIGILVHYFFLAAFCWMNIIALDLWLTFSKQFMPASSSSKSTKRWYLYNIYAWMVPFIIVTTSVILDNVNIDANYSNFKPGYGKGACWITSRDALLLFFAGPLAMFKLFDIVAFIFTAVHIYKAKQQGAMARQKQNTCSFLLNIKLSLVMGLTWVFAFVANIANLSALWYLFIVFNSLQGLSICLSFLCTKKVTRLVREKYEDMSKVSATSDGTNLTTLSRSGDKKT